VVAKALTPNSTVIARLDRAIQYTPAQIETLLQRVLGHPPSRVTTIDCVAAPSATL